MGVDATVRSPFGAQLRRWRDARGWSQLVLASRVGSTTRHVSFLETGRSRPTRQMVLRLGEALDVPLRERNELLHAAGLAAAFPERRLDSADLAPFRGALVPLLDAHLPYPAMVLDRHWTVVLANAAGDRLYGPGIVGVNLVRRYVMDEAARSMMLNWDQVAWAMIGRLRAQQAREAHDAELGDLLTLAEGAVGGAPRPTRRPPSRSWHRGSVSGTAPCGRSVSPRGSTPRLRSLSTSCGSSWRIRWTRRVRRSFARG